MSLVTIFATGALFAAGIWLLLDTDRVRMVLGAGLLGHGAVLLIVLRGSAGDAPLVGVAEAQRSDAILQALALTAIVIGLAVSAYLLAAVGAGSASTTEEDEDR